MVLFGCEILKRVPGRVSTEVDARYSYDTQKTIEKARQIIGMYQEMGIEKERVLVKVKNPLNTLYDTHTPTTTPTDYYHINSIDSYF